MTASLGTLQKSEIFWRNSLLNGFSQRATRMCGVMPISRKLGDGLLRRFGFQFTGGLDERHVSDMQEERIGEAQFSANSRIASRKADLRYRRLSPRFPYNHIRLRYFGRYNGSGFGSRP